ncbi:MAG: hypothetical protein M1825_003303 [Sarcosagium campestre]|nr:MAG: hypothetical protein M1825_003303 [Sarcosagium campestre]
MNGDGLNTQDYRHVIISIGRTYIPGGRGEPGLFDEEDEEEEDEGAEDALDLQANHGGVIARLHYGVRADLVKNLDSQSIAKFRQRRKRKADAEYERSSTKRLISSYTRLYGACPGSVTQESLTQVGGSNFGDSYTGRPPGEDTLVHAHVIDYRVVTRLINGALRPLLDGLGRPGGVVNLYRGEDAALATAAVRKRIYDALDVVFKGSDRRGFKS